MVATDTLLTAANSGGSGIRAVNIDGWDIMTIILYFVVVMGIGVYSMIGVNRGTEEGYFLAGRFMTWLPVAGSLFATNIGSEHYVGLSGSGAQAGIGVASFELNALFLLPLLAWVFLPVYIASGVSTLPEYMTKRFGGTRIQMYLAVVSLLMYIFTKNSVDMFSGALFIKQAVGWNIYLSVFLLLGMTVLSTLTGGLAAVIYTDTLQCVIMIIGALALFIMGMVRVGGFESLHYKYPRAVSEITMQSLLAGNETRCGVPVRNAFELLRKPTDDEMPWAGFVFGQTTSSLWYWCTDQMMVQRVLAAKDLSNAQGGCVACGFIKIIPMFAMVMPGMISRVLYPDTVACATRETCMEICESEHSCSNIAYPKLMLGLMPAGLRGFMMAVLLSATMSDLSSTFNSASTLFTMDLYKYIRKDASLKELMIVGRLAVVAVVAAGILMIPVVQIAQGDQLFTYIQAITNCLSPPLAAAYLLAILWPRTNETGTFWGMMIGLLAGIIRMALEFAYTKPHCDEDDLRPPIVKNFHYMYYALLSFWLTTLCIVVISLFTPKQDPEMALRTTFWSRNNRNIRSDELKDVKDLPAGLDLDEAADYITAREKEKAIQDKEIPLRERAGSLITEDITIKRKAGCVATLRRGYDWFCGIEDSGDAVEITPEDRVVNLKKMTSLDQDPTEGRLLAAAAVFLMLIGLFLYIFFSIPFKVKRHPLYYFDKTISPD